MHETLQRWGQIHWGANSLLEWGTALFALLVVWFASRMIHRLFVGRLGQVASRTETEVDDVGVLVLQETRWYFHASLALLVAHRFATLSPGLTAVLRGLIVIALGFQLALWAQTAATGAAESWARRSGGNHNATIAAGVRFVSRLIIWTVVSLLILSNLGVEISAVLTGLGVGGIATALAVQSILADLIAGLSMYFDRPFDIGDSVTIDAVSGTVDKIGLRTTRFVATGGEHVVIPNGTVVKSVIRNHSRLTRRRVSFTFGLKYGVNPQKLERAGEIVAHILQTLEHVQLDRVHLKTFADAALQYEVVYFVTVPSHKIYMDQHEKLCLEIYRQFAEEQIVFASPVQLT